MTFSTGLSNATQAIINQTTTQIANNVTSPQFPPPVQNQYAIGNANSPASNSLVVPSQGQNQNPCGRMCDIIPQAMCNEYNVVASVGGNTGISMAGAAVAYYGTVPMTAGANYLYRL